MILGISSKKQGGKTTTIDHLKKQLMSDYAVHCFADSLKIVVVQCFIPAGTKPKGMSSIDWVEHNKDFVVPALGMNVRQLLQFFGTDIVRGIWSEAWVNAWKNRVLDSKSAKYVLVGDVRFPNEVQAIQSIGGKVIRLTRAPHPEDAHASETELDGWGVKDESNPVGFDAIVDNANKTIEQTNKIVWDMVFKGGWVNL